MTVEPRFRLLPMTPRDPHEPGRVASSLELFFDLVFVIAVGVAATHLHAAYASGASANGLLSYAIVFFGIWWAWMNFTWFATSFATDDWLYRVVTIVQMGGVLVLAAGIGPVFDDRDFTVLIIAYVIMRLAMVAQWIRASHRAGSARRATIIYATGIAVVQALWLASLLLPPAGFTAALVVLIVAELAVPVVAERTGTTPWHPHHITERYGLFTLILLGEGLLGSADAIIDAVRDVAELGPLIALGALTLIATAALWWIYFWPPHHRAIGGFGGSLLYGYGHYFIFAAAGALSTGIEIEADALTGRAAVPGALAAYAVALPLAVFLAGVWVLAIRRGGDRVVDVVVLAAVLVILLAPATPVPLPLAAATLMVTVGVLVWRAPVRAIGGADAADAG